MLLRIVSCDYSPLRDQFVLQVDAINLEDRDLDRTYFIVAPRKDVLTEDTVRSFIEDEIVAQLQATPDWTGHSWKSSRV